MGGLGYLEVLEDGSYKGPIDKFIPDDCKEEFRTLAGLEVGDTISLWQIRKNALHITLE